MVKLIMGLQGSGKTKKLVELVEKAIGEEDGDVVCIERKLTLTYDIPREVRLVDASQYNINSFVFLKGFISGLHSANYDMTHIFIDSVLRIVNSKLDEDAVDFFEWCEDFGKRENVKFTITVSMDINKADERLKKYF